jgi:ribosomal protein S6--L-glutamate ligase
MILSFHPVIDADRQIIIGSRNLDAGDMELIRKAEAILLPQTCRYSLYKACQGSSVHIFPNYDMRFQYSGKMGQSRLFKEKILPSPVTYEWTAVAEFEMYLSQKDSFPHDIPFFIKTNRGHEGEGIFLVEKREAVERVLNQLQVLEHSGTFGFVSQELIPTEGNVLRAVIFNKSIITYWKRSLSPVQMITTINRGARIDEVWRPDLQEKGKLASHKLRLMTGINLAAVDFVFDFSRPDPEPLFLELNYSFGRRGLGGLENFYRLLYQAVVEWFEENGLDSQRVKLT